MKFETGIALGVAVALAAAFGWAAVTSADNAKLKIGAGKQAACNAWLVTGQGDQPTGCEPALVGLVDTARASKRCDQALLLDGVSLDCSFAVQGLYARKADLQTQLETTVADQTAAIARAEKRATDSAQRKIQDATALASAPRQPDGLINCDAVCLRQRFEP